MKKIFFAFVLLFGSLFSVNAAGSIYKTSFLIDDVEITLEVIDVVKKCENWGYHYGEKVNIKSKSLNNRAYNLTFNIYMFSGLGYGNSSYGGAYTITNSHPNLVNLTIFNNGKEVKYPSLIKCKDLTTDNIDLIGFQIDYWGTFGGTYDGKFISPLPIELISFDATANQNQVDLTWVTGSEKNNDFFTIERTVDGIDFEEVGKVAGQGNSSIKNQYTFTDFRPKNGVSYYRLKQTDYNGESEYFEVKSVNIQKREFVSNVYPNPAVMNRTTVFVEKTSSIVTMNVRNVLGQLISSKEIDATYNDVTEEVELIGSDKMYFIELIQNNANLARYKVLNN